MLELILTTVEMYTVLVPFSGVLITKILYQNYV